MIKYLTVIFILCGILQAKIYNETITNFELVRVRDGDTFVINLEKILTSSKKSPYKKY